MFSHPLNRHMPLKTLIRFLQWQLGSKILIGSAVVPFIGGTRLLVKKGMTGATGNIYCGLHDFQDMAFLMHMLKPDDLFVDVGANIGSYTILAGGVCGASVLSIEPIRSTYECLLDNLYLNRLNNLVIAKNIGIGSNSGSAMFSESLGPGNRIIEKGGAELENRVSLESLDVLLRGLSPTLIKIDVEGYETEVINGASNTMMANGLLAVIMELQGLGSDFGFDEDNLHAKMLNHGFKPYEYKPFERKLVELKNKDDKSSNTLYIRDIDAVKRRVDCAPTCTWNGVQF